jgi:hypothetical protein
MAKIPNPRWAYPDVDGTSGGILIDAPVVDPPPAEPVIEPDDE